MAESRNVAFVGLGVMGYPMAGHLAAAGHQVTVYNRTEQKAEDWLKKHNGSSRPTPAEAASEAEIVFMCVGNDDDVRSVAHGPDGVFSGAQSGSIVVDHTTASMELAEELDEAAHLSGCTFLDAPLSGGQAGADNAQLTIMVGGDQNTFDRAFPVLDVYAKIAKLMGGVGAGQLTKMVNQVCIAGILQGLSEGLHLAEKAGMDIGEIVEVISNGAAQSWQMDNRAATMADRFFEYGFAVNWMRKDLDIALRTARRYGARMPLSALVDQFYADVQAFGGGRWDTSSLIERLRRVEE